MKLRAVISLMDEEFNEDIIKEFDSSWEELDQILRDELMECFVMYKLEETIDNFEKFGWKILIPFSPVSPFSTRYILENTDAMLVENELIPAWLCVTMDTLWVDYGFSLLYAEYFLREKA